MKHAAKVGTISHGTLRTEDLLDAFSTELSYLAKGVDHPGNRQTYDELVYEAQNISFESDEEASNVIDSLIDCLNELAPPYCYFGAIDGDGSDFGFWPDMDAIEDLPRVGDPGEVRVNDEDWLFVNDHGNVTVYSGVTCQPILEFV